MTKWTKGPWVNTNFTRYDGEPIRSAEDVAATVAHSAGYSERAVLFGVTLNDKDEDGRSTVVCYTGNGPRAEFNARLIAAAPALYEALMLVLPLAKGYSPAGQTDTARRTCQSWIEAAEAALLSAKGEDTK